MSRSSTIKPRTLRNAEHGKRCFILANGPSILREDLTRLRGELVIGMNASTLLEKEHGFETAYYTLSDSRFLAHATKRAWATTDLGPATVRVLRDEMRSCDEPMLAERTAYVEPLGRDGFSPNLASGFYFGCTTTMLAIQLAYFLGCSEIHLLGVDMRYPSDSPRFYKESAPQVEDAFTSVQLSNILLAHAFCKARGIAVYNCSERSFLRPYIGFQSFAELFPSSLLSRDVAAA